MLWEGFGFGWAETAYSGVTFPLVEPALEKAAKLGFRRIVVFPYFLFTGILVQRIYDATDAVAARHPEIDFVKAPYLNDHPLVLETFVDRVHEILDGQNLMNCALCKYREQILGFEAEVGLPQESHHHHVEGILGGATEAPFSQREKVAAKQPDEGMRRSKEELDGRRRNPSPVASGDTLSLWERESDNRSVLHYEPTHSHGHHHHGADEHHPIMPTPTITITTIPLPARRSSARAALAEAEVKCSTTSATRTRSRGAPSRSSRRRPTWRRCRKTSGRSRRGSCMLAACRTSSRDLAFSDGAGDVGQSRAASAARRSSATCAWSPSGLMTRRAAGRNPVSVAIDEPGADELAAPHRPDPLRRRHGACGDAASEDSIVVIGNAPTALFRLLELVARRRGKTGAGAGLSGRLRRRGGIESSARRE